MKILVEAYFDNNFGDDLMVKMLLENLKEHQVYLACGNSFYYKPFEGYKNTFQYSLSRNWLVKVNQIRKFDIHIKIGGSIFIVNTPKKMIKRMLEIPLVNVLKVLGLKTMVIGCNLGPFYNKLSESITSRYLKSVDCVTVRDLYSYKLLSSQEELKNVFYFPDMILAYKPKLPEEGQGENGCLGISAYRGANNPDAAYVYYSKMADIADRFVKRTGKKVLIFAFDSGLENDLAAAYNILDRMERKEQARIVAHISEPDRLIDCFSKCSAVISVRFHSAILCMNLGIPFVPVIYSGKMENLLNDIGYTGARYYLDRLGNIDTDALLNSVIDKEGLCKSIDSSYVEKSEGHMAVVNRFTNPAWKGI